MHCSAARARCGIRRGETHDTCPGRVALRKGLCTLPIHPHNLFCQGHEPGMSLMLQVQAHLIRDVCTVEGDQGRLAGWLVSRRSARRRALAAPVGQW